MNTKIIAAIGALALCPAVVHADVSSANIVGYSNASVPSYWSVFAPIFKNCDASGKVYLSQITPKFNADTALNSDGNVFIQVIEDSTAGAYGQIYLWFSSLGGWSADEGKTKIADDAVPLTTGAGFAICNNVKAKSGAESYSKGSANVAIVILCSGEVDLVCKNTVPSLWSVSGNNSPVKRYLSNFTPTLEDGTPLNSDGNVFVQKIEDANAGAYGQIYLWFSSLGGWSADEGKTKIADDAVPFEPGEGFAICNNVKMKSGAESYSKGSTNVPILLNTKSPLAE